MDLSTQPPQHRGDLKLLFVPILFLLLRIWTTVIDFTVYYNANGDRMEAIQTRTIAALVILSVSESIYIARISTIFDI